MSPWVLGAALALVVSATQGKTSDEVLVPEGEPADILERANWRPMVAVMSVAMSPDGRPLASGSGDQTVRLWEVATGRELRRLQGHTSRVSSVAIGPDGHPLAEVPPPA